MAGIPWTQEEELLLKSKCNAEMSFAAISKLFDKRTAGSLQVKARRMGWDNFYRYRKYNCNQQFWDKVNDNNSYWAGFIAADGCVRYTDGTYTLKVELNEIDTHQLERFNTDTSSEYPVLFLKKKAKRESKNISSMCYTYVNDKSWASGLENNFGIFPRKTWSLKPPPISEEFFPFWLSGFLDGDGCYHYDKITNMFSISISLAVSEPLEKLLSFAEQFPQEKKKKRIVSSRTNGKFKYFRASISGKSAVHMAHYLMSLPCFHMKRKYEYVKSYLDGPNNKYNLSLPSYEEHLASLAENPLL